MTVSRARTFCAVDGCTIPGVHSRDCLNRPGLVTCNGCMPGSVMEGGPADGSLICYRHHQQAVRALLELPDLYDALGEALAPYKSPQAPRSGGGTGSDLPAAVSSDAVAARRSMVVQLARMVGVVVARRSFYHPANTVEAYVGFLETSAPWLSKQTDYAPYWGSTMQTLASHARRIAYPGRRPGTTLGVCPVMVSRDGQRQPCGSLVRYEPPVDERPKWEQPDAAADKYDQAVADYMPKCEGCGTREPVTWWALQIIGAEPPERMTAPELASWLSMSLHRNVDAGVIRQWAHRRQIEPVDRTETGRPRYDRGTVEAVARLAYQQPKERAS